jgi:hypothetical protein
MEYASLREGYVFCPGICSKEMRIEKEFLCANLEDGRT